MVRADIRSFAFAPPPQINLANDRYPATLGEDERLFRKAAIGSAWIAAIFVILLVVFYAEEDWRGAL